MTTTTKAASKKARSEHFVCRAPHGFRARANKLRGYLIVAHAGEEVTIGVLLDELVRRALALHEVIADGKAGGR